jgi:Transposase DDE domain
VVAWRRSPARIANHWVFEDSPFRQHCPIENTSDGKFTLEFTDKERRLAGRRVEEATDVYKERYAARSGIESTNSGLKNRLGLGRLRVRGRGSVFRVLLHKIAGWNVLRASASTKLRAWVKTQVAQTLKESESGPTGRPFAPISGLPETFWVALALYQDGVHRFSTPRAA